ncbi:hypothetical protein HW555_007552, partial [Spodoptera exigua]
AIDASDDGTYALPCFELLYNPSVSQNIDVHTNEDTSEACSVKDNSADKDKWTTILEQQNNLLAKLIEVLRPQSSSGTLTLPDFNPGMDDNDPNTWLSTADSRITPEHQEGPSLMAALSHALKGDAAYWFSSLSSTGMKWGDFKALFKEQYSTPSTPASYLMKLYESTPKENEGLAPYAENLVTGLLYKWNNLTREQIAMSVVVSHISKFDSRVLKLAKTINFESWRRLSQEMKDWSYNNKSLPSANNSPASNNTESTEKPSEEDQCLICNEKGHKSPYCRSPLAKKIQKERMEHIVMPFRIRTGANAKKVRLTTCNFCNEKGHYTVCCPIRYRRRPKKSIKAKTSETSAATATDAGNSSASATDTYIKME